MKLKQTCLIALLLLGTGCRNNTSGVWEDTKSIGRYINRTGKMWLGKETESKQIQKQEEFVGPSEEEFIPLKTEDLKEQTADATTPQPKADPGTKNSPIPSIDHFKAPDERLSTIFRNLYFETDEHVLRNKEYYAYINKISNYLKEHKETFVFVTGHCDERASEAYNLALGTKRANAIRNLLIKRGVDPKQIYTISFGKEMPADTGHTHTAWAKNRRVEFKLYDKR